MCSTWLPVEYSLIVSLLMIDFNNPFIARMLSQVQKTMERENDMPRPVRKRGAKTAKRRYLQLKISLKNISPTIWRRFVIPTDFTLADLHDCIQIIMGWENSHLYEFNVGGRRDGRCYMGSPFGVIDDFDDAEDPANYDLDFLTKKGMKFTYIYDMGDSWDHAIVVENANYDHRDDEPPVFVLAGKRNGPPEDCGGSWGYTELVEALADGEHPQHQEMKEWIDEYDSEEFDLEECNTELIKVFGSPKPQKKAVKKASKKAKK